MTALPPVLILYNRPGTLSFHQFGVGTLADEGVLEEVAAVESTLRRLGAPVRTEGIRSLGDALLAIQSATEHCVFNLVEALEGDCRDMALIPALCRAVGKACTGNGEYAQWVCLDKIAAQRHLADAGLATPGGCRVGPGDPLPSFHGLVIVKPLRTDAGEGIDDLSVLDADDRAALDARCRHVHETFGQPALVEPFIDGREINVSVVEFDDGPRVMPLAEIEFIGYGPDKPRIVGYEAKWETESHAYKNTVRRLPAKLPEPVAERIRKDALRAWNVIECRDYTRFDLRLDSANVPWFIEVNPNPDITPGVGLSAAIKVGGLTFDAFIERGIRLALRDIERHAACAPSESAAQPVTNLQAPDIALMRPDQRDATLQLLRDTCFFEPYEIDVAAEVIDTALQQGPSGDYMSYVSIDPDGSLSGWVCFGRTPCTASTWDIYWLAVRPATQGRGLGRALMAFAERAIAEHGGTLAIVETAGRSAYAPTRAFYERIGYKKASVIADFYALGDPKVIYTRRLGATG